MRVFGVVIGILQYAGLYIQLNAALNVGHGEVDNHISGNVPPLSYLTNRLKLLYRSKQMDRAFYQDPCL
ncbi:hypothetical protein JOQ06_014443, partial [Pogonophryne albipinna]